MRRKRRTKYNWLPTVGTPSNPDSPTIVSCFQVMQLQVASEDIVTGWRSVVENAYPTELSEPNFPLNDIIGNEYIVKRIVGKVFVDVEYQVTPPAVFSLGPPNMRNIAVSAGLYVSRIEPDGAEPPNPVQSISANHLYSPLNNALVREPWMWRRTWMLGAGGLQSTIAPDPTTGIAVVPSADGNIRGAYPWNNSSFSGVNDGPHVDAKTGRRVRQDEALFFGASAHLIPFESTQVPNDLEILVNLVYEFRVLGALRRARNRSNF